MFKKLTAILVLLMLVFSTMPAYAANHDCGSTRDYYWSSSQNVDWRCAQEPVIYKSEIKVTKNGGEYKVGFVTVDFPRNFINDRQLPVVIKVQVYAERGKAYIEFTPDLPDFNKDVTISVQKYSGLLFDKASRKNIQVNIRSQKFKVEHFSRYAFS